MATTGMIAGVAVLGVIVITGAVIGALMAQAAVKPAIRPETYFDLVSHRGGEHDHPLAHQYALCLPYSYPATRLAYLPISTLTTLPVFSSSRFAKEKSIQRSQLSASLVILIHIVLMAIIG